jgi:hypothetical protein
MKTPEEMAKEYADTITTSCCGTSDIIIEAEKAFLAGYKSRQQEIDELKANWTFACEDKARALKELARAEINAQPQWISVKYRLPPEQDNQLLFLSIYKDVYLGGIELVSTNFGEFHLTYNGGHGYLDRANKVITHWMPLPNGPEEPTSTK